MRQEVRKNSGLCNSTMSGVPCSKVCSKVYNEEELGVVQQYYLASPAVKCVVKCSKFVA
jgi:hypothetical protein